MQRLQHALLLTAALAFLTTCVALALAAHPASPATLAKSEDCGTYRSDSIYPRGRVVAIRGVSCDKAREVAKRFDHTGDVRGPWKCAYAHGGGRSLFSCGYGDNRGDIRDWPHALKAVGVGSPS